MNESIQLLSSMSPKVKSGKKVIKKGPSILALKTHFRRSSICDTKAATVKNDSLCIIEASSTEETCSSTASSVKGELRNINLLNKTPIYISDSNVSDEDEGTNYKAKKSSERLPKTKMQEIEKWVGDVNKEKSVIEGNITQISEKSTILYDDFRDKILECDRLLNSTKLVDNYIRPEEKKDISVISETTNEDDLGQRSIPDSFEEDLKPNCSDSEGSEKDGSLSEQMQNMLDQLYGDSWRSRKEHILPKSEKIQRTKQKTKDLKTPVTERKPKLSVLYKNPYTETEVKKSNNLLRTLQTQRMKKEIESPWVEKLKNICDSDTNSEPSDKTNFPKTKLIFESEDDEISNKENRILENLNKKQKHKNKKNISNSASSSNNSDSNNYEPGQIQTKILQKKPKDFKNNDKRTLDTTKHRKPNRYSSSSSELSDFSDNFEPLEVRIKKKAQNNKNKDSKTNRISSSSSNNSEYVEKGTNKTKEDTKKIEDDKKQPIKKVQTVVKKALDPKNDKFVTPKIKEGKKIHKEKKAKVIIDLSDSDSDDLKNDFGWKANINYKKTEPKIRSFLASLTSTVPVANSDPTARIFRNNFKQHKEALVEKLYNMFNENIFNSSLPSPPPIIWNDRLTNTAGYCKCRKIIHRNGNVERDITIELSTKVLDSADRLRDTLVHEMCHAANHIVNHVSDGHGPLWKAWANKAMKTYPELPAIKRCHTYAISTKYTYRCTGCGYSIGRHRKSLDIERKRCGYCYGKFEILINKKGKEGLVKSVPATPKKEATGFALFVKENYATFKTPQLKHGDVMRLLGQKFADVKLKD